MQHFLVALYVVTLHFLVALFVATLHFSVALLLKMVEILVRFKKKYYLSSAAVAY